MRRVEDKIRRLCTDLTVAKDDTEVRAILAELQDALHEYRNAFDRVFPTIQSSLNDAPETRFQKTRDSFSARDIDGRYWAQPLLASDAA